MQTEQQQKNVLNIWIPPPLPHSGLVHCPRPFYLTTTHSGGREVYGADALISYIQYNVSHHLSVYPHMF